MLVLYFAPGSSSMAPHIALHEAGLPIEGRPLSFAGRQQRTSEFLAQNPAGKVPLLLVDGRPLTEVAGILYFIAKSAPQAELWPRDLAGQAQVVSWMSFVASVLHPGRQEGVDHAYRVYGIADRRLGGRTWAVGDNYTIADIHLFRLYWRMRNALKPDPNAFPSLEAHYQRTMDRPAVKRTIEVEQAVGYELPA
jgi:glutathione S-transferase